MLRPLSNNVVAEPVELEKMTATGLFISQNASEQMQTSTAKVLAVGEKVASVKIGDEIVYKPYATFDFKHSKKTYVLVAEEDILGVVDGQ